LLQIIFCSSDKFSFYCT